MRRPWVMVLLGGCDGGPGPAACEGDSAAVFVCGGDVAVDIGTGEDVFAPLIDGGRLDLQRGSQGLQHVFLSARAAYDPTTLAVERANVRLSMWDVVSGTEALPALQVGLPWQAGPGGIEVIGIQYVVSDAASVVDRRIGLALSVQPVGADQVARGWREVQVQWAADGAPPP